MEMLFLYVIPSGWNEKYATILTLILLLPSVRKEEYLEKDGPYQMFS
jgi:hypothetical protein